MRLSFLNLCMILSGTTLLCFCVQRKNRIPLRFSDFPQLQNDESLSQILAQHVYRTYIFFTAADLTISNKETSIPQDGVSVTCEERQNAIDLDFEVKERHLESGMARDGGMQRTWEKNINVKGRRTWTHPKERLQCHKALIYSDAVLPFSVSAFENLAGLQLSEQVKFRFSQSVDAKNIKFGASRVGEATYNVEVHEECEWIGIKKEKNFFREERLCEFGYNVQEFSRSGSALERIPSIKHGPAPGKKMSIVLERNINGDGIKNFDVSGETSFVTEKLSAFAIWEQVKGEAFCMPSSGSVSGEVKEGNGDKRRYEIRFTGTSKKGVQLKIDNGSFADFEELKSQFGECKW